MQPNQATGDVRNRVSVELSPSVLSLLDNVCAASGMTRASVINSALMDSLPRLFESVQAVEKMNQQFQQAQLQKSRQANKR